MHSPSPPQVRTPASPGESPANDRVGFFRRLFLILALGSMAGVAAALTADDHADLSRLALMAASTLALGWGWILWHRRGAFPRWTVPLEALLFVTYTLGMRDPLNLVGICYAVVTYRATFGSPRDVRITTASYVLAYVTGLGLVAGAAAVLDPIQLVYVFAIAFGAYISATLADVLRRDRLRVVELSTSREALRESEQRLRSVADCLREALLITDADDHIILANARVREVLGYAPDEVIGKVAAELLLPKNQRNIFSDRMRRRLSGETELYEAELVRKDGSTIFAEISASPYRDFSGDIIGTLGAISDITERKRLEERLRQSLRLEAVGQLAGGVAHDFNNLLTVVKCHTELLLADLPSTSPLRESMLEIGTTVDKGASLIQQLLAFSRQQLLQPRRLTLAEAVTNAEPLMRDMLGPKVELVVAPEDPGDVFVDPTQVEQVLVTLVRNANEAMPEGGRIVVQTRSRALERHDPRVGSFEAAPGRYSMLVVSDNGSGMSNDVLKRIFEPFFTTKEPGQGSGLGLASMYGVVRQSGGFVEVESSPGRGTTFRVYLPSAPSWEGAPITPHDAGTAVHLTGPNLAS